MRSILQFTMWDSKNCNTLPIFILQLSSQREVSLIRPTRGDLWQTARGEFVGETPLKLQEASILHVFVQPPEIGNCYNSHPNDETEVC